MTAIFLQPINIRETAAEVKLRACRSELDARSFLACGSGEAQAFEGRPAALMKARTIRWLDRCTLTTACQVKTVVFHIKSGSFG